MSSITELLGRVLADIRGDRGDEEIRFTDIEGVTWRMYHEQDCCESVIVEDICGDLKDLIGSPIVEAEEVSNSSDENSGSEKPHEYAESWTWTFYKLRTAKGAVTIRWLGQSNGYYSESVSFYREQ